MKLPSAVGLTFCKKAEVAPGKGISLVSLFHSLRFSAFPAVAEPFIAYTSLYDGEGEGTIELTCMRLETENDIYKLTRWLNFPERGMYANLDFGISNCVFPAPGRYQFELRFDGFLFHQRAMDIIRESSKNV